MIYFHNDTIDQNLYFFHPSTHKPQLLGEKSKAKNMERKGMGCTKVEGVIL